jgi:hypothetical protein
MAIMLMLQVLFERGDRFGDLRDRVAHGLPSGQA